MELFRISLKEFSDKLFAPGFKGRWNEEGQYVIYTASSRSLACLENLAHRNEIPAEMIFATMVIHGPDDLAIHTINLQDLPPDWLAQKGDTCPPCLEAGTEWYNEKKSPIFKVPSAVVPYEWNYVLNTKHKDFTSIRLLKEEPFYFDNRLGVKFPKEDVKPLRVNK